MGGFVSAEVAIQFPERVSRLVLVSAAGISSADALQRADPHVRPRGHRDRHEHRGARTAQLAARPISAPRVARPAWRAIRGC